MKLSIIPILLLIFCFSVNSCTEEEELVDATLQIYLDRFREEAAIRNITVNYDTRPVEAKLEIHEGEGALGWCNYDIDAHNTITINLVFWNVLDELGKEKLLFHELGHCILGRPHLDRLRKDGRCHSIMHSGQACADDYSEETREIYLDELFLR